MLVEVVWSGRDADGLGHYGNMVGVFAILELRYDDPRRQRSGVLDHQVEVGQREFGRGAR